ncbi:MAG TPA: beta-phosphoglucomutase family hydrolase [Bacteroidetes bacterium]|nr:beta-phosphoglucomutase family hydrolase [Bacteroidota bacterium]
MNFKLPDGIEGMIFDLDGTLANTMPLHMQAWKQACQSFGMDMSSEFLRSFTGTPGKNIARAIIRYYDKEDSVDPEIIAERKKENFMNMQHLVKEVKPVADIVRDYHGRKAMALGTGGHRDTVLRTLEVIGMKDYFKHIVTADDVSRHKPDPETFIKCAGLLGIAHEKIIVFEDGDLGIRAARIAGMHPVDVRSWYEYSW